MEPAPEYLERLTRVGKDTSVVWRFRRQLSERRLAGQTLVEHLARSPVDKPATAIDRLSLELHMDGIYGAATPSGRKQFIKDLSRQMFKRGWGKPYEHLKRLRTPMKDETRPQPSTNCLESVADQLELTGAKPRPAPGLSTDGATDGRNTF